MIFTKQNWQGKEYRVVVRSGQSNLGEWLQERRNLYSDYKKYMGEPPARIVKVWLIANSIFQRKPGECNYADIATMVIGAPVISARRYYAQICREWRPVILHLAQNHQMVYPTLIYNNHY